MKILAFEFSAPQRSVAVLNAREGVTGGHALSEVVFTGGQSVPALGMVGEALQKAGLEREQIDTIVVGLGPGSYNGIRVALALARGWELARPVRLIGFSTIESLAFQAAAENLEGRIAVVIDAQRGEVYLQEFEMTTGSFRSVEELRLASPDEALSRAAAGARLLGPEIHRWTRDGKLLMPRAASLAGMALNEVSAVPGQQLEPIYLREPSFVKAPQPRAIPPEFGGL